MSTTETVRVDNRWTEEELSKLRAAYSAGPNAQDISLTALAMELGRLKSNVCRKARILGLTRTNRPKVKNRKVDVPKYATAEERNRAIGEQMRRRIAEKGHPRGMLGLKHTVETLAVLSERSREMWRNPKSALNAKAMTELRRKHFKKMQAAGKMMRGGYVGTSGGGRRSDLDNMYFRSKWEANYARYLNYIKARGEIAAWEYESKTFVFDGIKRGTISYKPDFKIIHTDGRHEWHEVKGWMNQRSHTRLKRMARYYPEEKIVLIQKDWFRQAVRGGLAAVIGNWEGRY